MRRLTPLLALLLPGLLSCDDGEGLLASPTGTPTGTPTTAPTTPPATKADPLTLASPFVGSGGFGYNFASAFPGALWPQGLVKVGPDTIGIWGDINFLHYSGYWYGDDKITAFSHLHLHGTGATDYGVLGVMPLVGFDDARIPRDNHASPFRKETEKASPGYYAVTLDQGDIAVELTASAHTAHHRYRFPAGAEPALLVDLTHHLSGGTVTAVTASLEAGQQALRGRVRHVGGMSRGFGGYDVFFEARVNRPWKEARVWSGEAKSAAGEQVEFAQKEGQENPAGVALSFDPSSEPLELNVAVSLVSPEGAAQNLADQAPSFEFDAKRKLAEAEWRPLVGAIEVEGASVAAQQTVASALYHLYLMPTRVEDNDGHYRGNDGEIRLAEGFHYCSDLSLWDTYRTMHPMLALLAPERDRDAVMSLHEMARAEGFFPKWPIATGEAGTMIGSSAEVVLADAYLKGITGFDAADAYARMRAAAMDPVAPPGGRGGRDSVEKYLTLGYVPSSNGGSVSKTVEYAVNDMALGQLARALGQDADADALAERSRGWRKLYDPSVGFLRGHDESGATSGKKYTPTLFTDDYVEASGWHTLFGPLHDVEGLIELHGGREALVAKLEEFFEKGRQSYEDSPADGSVKGSGMRPYFWASNEPTMHIVYLFAQAGRPDLTQKWVRWIQQMFFRPTPDGLPGNDDGGTMSSWYLFNAMGFYPLAGTDQYFVGAPSYPKMVLHLPAGDFTIEAQGVSDTNLYVQSVELNGAPLKTPLIRHQNLTPGGSLRFVMGPNPSAWGAAKLFFWMSRRA